MVRSRLGLLAACGLFAGTQALVSCDPPVPAEGAADMATYTPRHLSTTLTWWGDNRKRLDAFMDTYGKGSSSYDASKKPIALFDWDKIPWDELAFPSVHWALGHFRETAGQAIFAPRGNPTDGL